jgi:hypothetical protein
VDISHPPARNALSSRGSRKKVRTYATKHNAEELT